MTKIKCDKCGKNIGILNVKGMFRIGFKDLDLCGNCADQIYAIITRNEYKEESAEEIIERLR